MGIVLITTKTCPCCKYQYKTMEKKGKVKENEEVVEKTTGTGIPRGREDFIPIIVAGPRFWPEKVIGIECPNCGIHMNAEKCTTREEIELK